MCLLQLTVGDKPRRVRTKPFCIPGTRALPPPTTVTTDGAPGMINAVEAVFERSVRIWSWFHYVEDRIMPTWREGAPWRLGISLC